MAAAIPGADVDGFAGLAAVSCGRGNATEFAIVEALPAVSQEKGDQPPKCAPS
jgi:hypothetical protein